MYICIHMYNLYVRVCVLCVHACMLVGSRQLINNVHHSIPHQPTISCIIDVVPYPMITRSARCKRSRKGPAGVWLRLGLVLSVHACTPPTYDC